ncbi:MAG: hypothetical protein V3V05_10735 [Pontiella sp.]
MMHKSIGKTQLSPVSFGSLCSYELCGDQIIGRLFGFIPVVKIHLAAVYYLRLATKSEVTPLYYTFNWLQFLPHRRSLRPVYVLQTRTRHRIFLKLEGSGHFKLRQAIGRYNDRKKKRAAA